MSIQSIQADLNDAQATLAKLESPNPFWGLSDAEATAKLSRLLLPFDRELSDRYAKLAEQAAENARAYGEKKSLQAEEAKTAKELKQMELSSKGILSPEEERRQLRINLGDVRRKIIDPNATSAERKLYEKEEQIYLREQAEDYPSTKRAAQEVSKLRLGTSGSSGAGSTGPAPVVTDIDKTVQEIKDKISALSADVANKKLRKGTDLDTAAKEIEQAILSADLRPSESNNLKALLESAIKGASAPTHVASRPKSTSSDIRPAINEALAALYAGNMVSVLDPNQPGDKQKIFKIAQRAFSPEAVNVGDVDLTKSYLEQFISKFTNISGEISSKEIASSLRTIQDKYKKAKDSLTSYIGDKYLSGVSEVTANLIKDALRNNPWVGGSTYVNPPPPPPPPPLPPPASNPGKAGRAVVSEDEFFGDAEKKPKEAGK